MIGTPKILASLLLDLDQNKEYEIKEYKHIRGRQANRYFHVLINQLARYNRSNNYAISDDEMKININLNYGTIATDENGKVMGCKVPKGTNIRAFYKYAKLYKEQDNCDCYIFYKRTSELNSLEFSQLLQGLVQECKDAGIETLDEIEMKELMKSYE